MALNSRIFALVVTLGIGSTMVHAQRPLKPLFTGEEHLMPCVVDLPLTYRRKHEERYMQAASELKDVELIYLQWDKRRSKAAFKRVYVVLNESAMGTSTVFLEGVDSHKRIGHLTEVIYPQFDERSERFYRADGFDAVLMEHPEIKAMLVQRR